MAGLPLCLPAKQNGLGVLAHLTAYLASWGLHVLGVKFEFYLIRFFYYFIWRVGAAFYFAGIVENGCGCFCFLIIFMQNGGIFRSEIFNNKNRQRQIDVKALRARQIFVSGLLVNKKARKRLNLRAF